MIDKINQFNNYILKYGLGSTLKNVSFKCLTSLKVGGTCELLYMPNNLDDLILSLKYLNNNDIEYMIIGLGTNILINDRHFEIVTISLKNLNKITLIEEKDQVGYIYVEAGVKSIELSKYLKEQLYVGGEFMSVIPGTIGGLTSMNAGAYLRSMSDIVESITYLDEAGNIYNISSSKAKFDYRNSMFKNSKYIIVSIIIQLHKWNGMEEEPKSKIRRYLNKKRESQPLASHNAGSVFKNNHQQLSWEIIDILGYRGYRCGDAQISTKHANFLINLNDATFNDMISIIRDIQTASISKLNISLETEWVIIY